MSDQSLFRIIVIDDNPSIHHDFIKILRTESSDEIDSLSDELFGPDKNNLDLPQFEIDVASQGQEGVAKIKQALEQEQPYALAFVDIRMPPGWDGVETIKHIWELDKNIQVVICTAYTDYSWEATISNLGKTDNLLILKKPFDNISVRQLASALTTKWQLAEKTRDYTSILKQQISDRTLSLEKSLSLIKSTFESSSDGIILINNEGTIIDYNNNLVSMLQLPQFILDAKSEAKFFEYLGSQLEDPVDYLARIQELKNNPEQISIEVIKFKNGKIFECYSQPHKLNDEIIGRILDLRDITKRATLENELRYQATHDGLTGLDNRVSLQDKMQKIIKTSQKNKDMFATLFIDFDRFKLINDSLSHAVGDELLKSASDRLKSVIAEDDVIARLGGDEFIIVLLNPNTKNEIKERVSKIIEAFQKPFTLEGRQVMLTASIGVSVYPENGDTTDVLIRNADAAMYHAKAQKGDNYKFFTQEMNNESLAKLDMEMELRQAIANNEFFLCYQPQVDLVKESLTAVEALIRWNHPTRGVLLPIDFIPTAEDSGLVVPICEWALKAACIQNKTWQDAGFPPIRVAVNIPSQQFKQFNVVDKIKHILEETGLDAKYLELELTENVILSNPEIVKVISELKKLGIIIAIDDFGTGYSSLSYLHKIPLDRLKIDSSFIKNIQFNTDDEVIIRAVIALAKDLKLEVLAEGVETADQVNFLRQYNAGDVQGFYFSKPLSTTEVEVFFDNPNNINKMVATDSKSKEK